MCIALATPIQFYKLTTDVTQDVRDAVLEPMSEAEAMASVTKAIQKSFPNVRFPSKREGFVYEGKTYTPRSR